MKMFSDCSGECCLCANGGGGCLAGHGDDEYWPANKEQIIERLDKGQFSDHTQTMKNYLKNRFKYDYDKERIERVPDLMEPITPENLHELTPGEWIWDNETISRRVHKKQISDERIREPIGFRQIHILDADDNGYGKRPFMLSTIDFRDNHMWECLKPNRFYKFKKEKENGQEIRTDKPVQVHTRLIGYSIRNQGELMVGVVLAKDIDDAKTILRKALRLNDIDDNDVVDIKLSSDGLCELYYGS